MRLAWVTDPHLDSADSDAIEAFGREILDASPDALVVTGDIGNARSLEDDLRRLRDRLAIPIHFVLGNHDYYGGGIRAQRERMRALHDREEGLGWLPEAGVVPLTDRTALIGHGGWADGRLGDFFGSRVFLNDFVLIEEFRALVGDARDTAAAYLSEPVCEARLALLKSLGDEAAEHLEENLPGALDTHEKVILATHVPPFRDACWYAGRISTDDWLPHMASRAAGEVLREVMAARPDRELLVLCGHTHGDGVARILPNLVVRTGRATYGWPCLQDVIAVE